jgi:hypothetical protein
MIGHEAETMHLPASFLAAFRPGMEEQRPIPLACKNRFQPFATIHGVIHRSRKLDTEFSCHRPAFAPEKPTWQRITRLCGTGPFRFTGQVENQGLAEKEMLKVKM